LQGFSHRKGAKDAKIFNDEVQDFKSFSKRFDFPSRSSFLRGKKVCFFSGLIRAIRG